MTTPGGELLGEARIDVDMDTDPATRALQQFSRDAQGRLRDLRGRFIREGEQISRSLERASGGGDGFSFSLRGIADAAGAAGPALSRVGLGLGAITAAGGGALPLLAGIATTLQSIAPAGAVAVSAMLAVQQATATIRLGMIGVEEAVTAAFDTSKEGAKAFKEALEDLSPSAREFALTVRELAPAFTQFQQSIQEELFVELGDVLRDVSSSVLPVLEENLLNTANSLGVMAASAALAAAQIADDGTLGVAMRGANAGLSNLSALPAQVVTALGQLAAAAAPAFDLLTEAAAGAATGISEDLAAAFESGDLREAIETAIDVIGQLGTIAGNVFGILRNVLGAASAEGGDTFAVLTEITQTLRDATATEGFQAAIGALVETMGVLATTAGPLLSSALAALGPVFTTLAGPAQTLITSLGAGLSPIIEALGPVLEAAAGAVGALVTSLAPLLPVVGNLIASLLPPLVPLLNVVAQLFTDLAPIVAQVGQILTAVLAPIIASLPQILAPLIAAFTQVTAAVLPLVSSLLAALLPAITVMGQSVADLAVALAPLIVMFAALAARILTKLTPVLVPLIALLGRLASVFANQLAAVINNVVVPAVRIITSIFRGDFTAAGRAAADVVLGLVRTFRTGFNNLRTAVTDALVTVIQLLRDFGPRALRALGNLGRTLFGSGQALIQGFIDGIRSQLAAVRDAASQLVDAAGDFFPGSPAKEGRFSGRGWTLYSGQATVDAFAQGMRDRLAEVVQAAGAVTSSTATALPVGRTPTITAAGQTAASVTSQVSVAAPNVIVMVGNEVINEHIQVRIDRNNATMARQLAQGVRR